MLQDLSPAFAELKRDEILETIKARIDQGEDPLKIMDDARLAMNTVGNQFQEGTLFLAEMMLAAEIFKEVVVILKPHLDKTRPAKPIGKIVLATPKGDIHDLGKNILATLLECHGFEVHDLGVDVESSLIIGKVAEVKPDFVGFSALITTSFASMKQATTLLENKGMRNTFKLMVGGGVTTPMLKDHIGADFQTTDAMEGVAYCLKIIEQQKNAR
jgi:methanogenic corrinoid protein MtbC1